MSNSVIKEQLREMAKLSILSNRISEIQEKNLKAYPFIFFNGVKSVKIEYDLSTMGKESQSGTEKHVTYHLDMDDAAENSHMDKRFYCIEEATRVLFWSDLRVCVVMNGKLVYESKENVSKSTSTKS